MLTQLSVRNLAVVKKLDIDFTQGLTTITGETGAGKSIAIDALGLCLGERADAAMVRSDAKKAEVSASFDLGELPQALQWLQEHDLDDEQDCLIRRVVSAEGRSKAYINGSSVSLQQLKVLGAQLISIHGQNAHHQLLKPDVQLHMIDIFAAHSDLLEQVESSYFSLLHIRRELQARQANQQQRADRRQLLAYQVKELDEFDLQENEYQALETEHRKLSHGQTLLEQAQISFHQLYEADEFNALSAVKNSLERISELQEHDPALAPIVTLLNEAAINIDEASQELRHYTEQLEIDPFRMQQVEARYVQARDLARKHAVQPETLVAHHQALSDEFADLSGDDEAIEGLQAQLDEATLAYQTCAGALSQSRQKAAQTLAEQVQHHIREMNMPHARFSVEVTFDSQMPPGKKGLDLVCFKVTTNPGQAADILEKVVSGGELSRIGLALQVISSHCKQTPTMIFDEVDTGTSGPTASIVGQLLRQLGNSTQVMCVTHLPQVAACGHQQMFVTKFSDAQTTETHMISLSESERIEELARLLAGDKLTETALANARELLDAPKP